MSIDYATCQGHSPYPWENGDSWLDHLFHRYTEGDCGLLVLAISQRTGWRQRWLEGSWGCHAVIELPDGRFLDVTGTSTWLELDDNWGEPEDGPPWEGDPESCPLTYRPVDDETARVAEELIALVMTEHEEVAA